jgi:predicted transposase YbfD/YdcC
VLGQVKVAEESNDIVAIPKLLDILAIEGAIVTIDAMGCQRQIAQTIIDKKADYVLALKGNQETLREDVEIFIGEQKANRFKDSTISQDTTIDGDHGRIETRRTTVSHDIDWLQKRHNWPRLKGGRRRDRQRARSRPQNRAQNPLLHHFFNRPGGPASPLRSTTTGP